jgi:hypothetical protein
MTCSLVSDNDFEENTAFISRAYSLNHQSMWCHITEHQNYCVYELPIYKLICVYVSIHIHHTKNIKWKAKHKYVKRMLHTVYCTIFKII